MHKNYNVHYNITVCPITDAAYYYTDINLDTVVQFCYPYNPIS